MPGNGFEGSMFPVLGLKVIICCYISARRENSPRILTVDSCPYRLVLDWSDRGGYGKGWRI